MSTPKIAVGAGLLLQFPHHQQSDLGQIERLPKASSSDLDIAAGFARLHREGSRRDFRDGDTVYSQGDPAECIFYLLKGRIKIAATSSSGKEAVIAILRQDCFFGTACLVGQSSARESTASSMGDSTVATYTTSHFRQRLYDEKEFLDNFITSLLRDNRRLETAIISQLLDRTEERLAQVLLQLAEMGEARGPESKSIAKVSHETLARMVGGSRARVSCYMKKFRDMGLIECDRSLRIYSALRHAILKK